jgi:hypothetical protein
MIEIQLTQGKTTIIDDEDADLAILKWQAHKDKKRPNTDWYAQGCLSKVGGNRGNFKLHRIILGRVVGRALDRYDYVDHINHDGLDNRRSNLRLATHQENVHNQRMQLGPKSSQYKGVYWDTRIKQWRAQITINKHRTHLGLFRIEEDAARAYDSAARKLFANFCSPNFPEDE